MLAGAPWVGAAASLEGYRLAGTVAVGQGHLGVLELPEGTQVLVREGSEVAGGRVVRLDARSLRLAFPEEELELPLAGLPRPAEVPLPEFVTAHSEPPGVLVREVDVDGLRRAMGEAVTDPQPAHRPAPGSATEATARERLTGRTGAEGPARPRDRSNPPGQDAATTVAQRFAPLVGLPPESRVVEVNEQPIGTAADALTFIETQLGQGLAVRLTLEGAPEANRVYLSPRAGGNTTGGAAAPQVGAP